MSTPYSNPKLSKATNKKGLCTKRHLTHVFRFNRYVDGFNLSVHPGNPERFPKIGIFRCTECGIEMIFSIKHRR